MITLAVDTSTRSGSLALLRDLSLLANSAINPDERYSVTFLRDLEALLARAAISLNQIDLFAVSAGPGSFTALRIGLTAVKAWAEIFGKPIAVISALEAVAALAVPDSSGQPTAARHNAVLGSGPENSFIAAVMDARQGLIFGGTYRRALNPADFLERVGDEVLVAPDEFLAMVIDRAAGASVLIASPSPDAVRPALVRSALQSSPLVEVSAELAPAIGRLGYSKALRGEVVDALHLDANYIRRPDAEVKAPR
jgi:tRNA threonylcarbamoyladenosine biosynthesis protein TsaB